MIKFVFCLASGALALTMDSALESKQQDSETLSEVDENQDLVGAIENLVGASQHEDDPDAPDEFKKKNAIYSGRHFH